MASRDALRMPFDRSLLQVSPIEAARQVLGCRIAVPAEGIVATITEVEAYGGPADSRWPDPAAHCYPGLTARNRAMFGPAGHWYVYRSYGIHFCLNVTCAEDGEGGGILIRSVRVDSGADAVRRRRGEKPSESGLGRGPGNVGQALGIDLSDYGHDALDCAGRLFLQPRESSLPEERVRSGPRVGVRRAAERPWRLWLEDDSVSAYRKHKSALAEF